MMHYLVVLLKKKIVSFLCMKIMDSKFLFFIGSLIQNKNTDQISKTFKKSHKYKYLKRQLNLKLIGISKRMRLNHTKFIKEISSF